MNAVDSLRGVSKILISHVAKYELQQHNGDGSRLFAYGSIYITNLSHITWEVIVGNADIDTQADAVSTNVALFNRESNYDMILPLVGFRPRFHPVQRSTEVSIEVTEVNEDNGFAVNKPISQTDRVLNALSDATAAFRKGEAETEYMTRAELAEVTDCTTGVVCVICGRLKDKGLIDVKGPNAASKGAKQAWRIKPDKKGFTEVHE